MCATLCFLIYAEWLALLLAKSRPEHKGYNVVSGSGKTSFLYRNPFLCYSKTEQAMIEEAGGLPENIFSNDK